MPRSSIRGDRPASAAEIAAALASGTPPSSTRDSATRTGQAARAAADAPPHASARARVADDQRADLARGAAARVRAGDEYLADGMLEDLTDTLSTTPGLRVRPAGIVRADVAPDPREVGQRLHVDHVVTGSLRRTPSGLRIATRLISVADGFQIWAHKTDCAEAEVLTVADQLARGIAEALSTRATSRHEADRPARGRASTCARAPSCAGSGATHAQAAADLLEQAVEYAPTSAPIARRVRVRERAGVGDAQPSPSSRRAPSGARARPRDSVTARRSSRRRSITSTAASPSAARWTSRARSSARRCRRRRTSSPARSCSRSTAPTQARQHFETARGLDPGRSQVIDADVARLDALERKWPDAERRIAALLADPDPSIAQLGVIGSARIKAWRGDTGMLADSGKQLTSRISSNAGAIFAIIRDLQGAGGIIDRDKWIAMVRAPLPPDRPLRQFLVRLQIFTEVAVMRSEYELAFDALAACVEAGLMDVSWMDKCPLLEQLVSDRRFTLLRHQVGERAGRVLAAFRGATTNQ